MDAYEKLATHLKFYLSITVLDFDRPAFEEYQRLSKSKLNVGPLDLKIASITLAQDATLLSRNLEDLEKVPGLKVEDWLT